MAGPTRDRPMAGSSSAGRSPPFFWARPPAPVSPHDCGVHRHGPGPVLAPGAGRVLVRGHFRPPAAVPAASGRSGAAARVSGRSGRRAYAAPNYPPSRSPDRNREFISSAGTHRLEHRADFTQHPNWSTATGKRSRGTDTASVLGGGDFRPPKGTGRGTRRGGEDTMKIQVLGPLSAEVNGGSIVPTAGKPRQILSLLALYPGRVMPVPTLMEELWGTELPASALTTLQTYILQLRRRLGTAMGPGAPTGAKDILATRPSPGASPSPSSATCGRSPRSRSEPDPDRPGPSGPPAASANRTSPGRRRAVHPRPAACPHRSAGSATRRAPVRTAARVPPRPKPRPESRPAPPGPPARYARTSPRRSVRPSAGRPARQPSRQPCTTGGRAPAGASPPGTDAAPPCYPGACAPSRRGAVPSGETGPREGASPGAPGTVASPCTSGSGRVVSATPSTTATTTQHAASCSKDAESSPPDGWRR